MNLSIPAVIVFSLILCSCNQSQGKSETPESTVTPTANETYTVDKDSLLKDFRTWYNYTYYNIRLEQLFIGLDADSNTIDQRAFLNQLATGHVVAYRTAKVQNTPVYKLYKPATLDKDIQSTSADMAHTAVAHLKMEGTQLPAYDFTDLEGKRYTPATTKGKLLVVKCWFINCFQCVQEFPQLNRLVDRYKHRSDIAFVSLASDGAKDLQAFLQKKPFNYAVVPGMDDYMTNKLAVNAYPLHLLINREGTIVKVTNAIDDLIPSLQSEIAKL